MYFPTLEFTGDSYGYACEILKDELFNGHHLLHKYFLKDVYLILKPLGLPIAPLELFRFLNLLASFGSILMLRAILIHRHWYSTRIYLGLLLVASSFTFIKYSFENEVYFFPILLSLVGSYHYELGKRYQAAIWLGFATLFHQIHIFWLIGLLIPKNWKQLKAYTPLVVGLFVPVLTYTSVGLVADISLTTLLFQDVQSGLVQVIPTLKNGVFFLINLLRTWIQIHGNIYLIWMLWNPFYSGMAIINAIFILVGFVIFIRERRFSFKKLDWYPNYIVALALQLLFALYSVGNIEFMVMIPFLFVLTLQNGSLLKHSLLLSIGILAWNWSQWFIPISKIETQRSGDIIKISERLASFENNDRTNDSALVFEIQDAQIFQNRYEYLKLLDSFKTIKNTHIPILFRQPNSSDSLDVYFEIKWAHSRLSRSKITHYTPQYLYNDTFTSRFLVYRDTGVSGILEFWKVTKRNTTN